MKKLFLSIFTCVFALFALGTATFAWFSMNQEVTATGMQVTAKSDSTFLIIGTSSDIAILRDTATGNLRTVDVAVSDAQAVVLPSAHNAIANTAASVVANWYTKVADAPTASASTGDATALTAFDGYVIHRTVYVALAEGSNDAYHLAVKEAVITEKTSEEENATIDPVRVLITSSSAAVEFTPASTFGEGYTPTDLAASISGNQVVQIDIWIYYDGNDAAVYTNNAANLNGATIELVFDVKTAE